MKTFFLVELGLKSVDRLQVDSIAANILKKEVQKGTFEVVCLAMEGNDALWRKLTDIRV